MLASIVNLTLHSLESVVDFLQFSLETLNVLAHGREAVLDVSQLVGVGAVVTSHSLEVSRENGFLATDLIEGTAGVILETFELAAHLG